MKYRDKPELRERLAAEYVLGTLRGRARTRFQAWLRDDASLRQIVEEWQARLGPLVALVPETPPPKRVWRAIESRLPARVEEQRSTSWWENLAFWRGLALATTAFAVTLAVSIGLRVTSPALSQAPTVASGAMQPSYVAMLENAQGNVAFVAYAARDSNELWVKRIAMKSLAPNEAYELWGLPEKAGAPVKSLGMVPAGDKGTMKLASVADQSLAGYVRLAISIEPAGGSKTGAPTGPVVYQGDCLKFW